jgi:hypothetical protein
MEKTLFQKYLEANLTFFAPIMARIGPEAGSMYVDPTTCDPVALNAMLRLVVAIAQTRNLRPIVMTTGFGAGKEGQILRSFAVPRRASTFGAMFFGYLANPAGVWRCLRRIRTGAQLVRLKIGSHPIGRHIYDHLLRRHGLPTLESLTARLRFEAAVEIAYYFGVKRLLDRTHCTFALLGDNTYRQGITFEILKERGTPSLCGIDINGMSAHLYRTRADYLNHCRTVDEAVVQALDRDPAIQDAARAALDARTSGREKQHDLIRAYNVAKRTPAAEELKREFGAGDGKKLVVVMAHIFQDAPHAYPGALFNDYSQWLIETCRRLARNPRVALIVKEHPSIELYHEQGTIDKVLEALGLEQVRIVKDLNTRSFFDCADVVVTCGGTCGMEFPCFGVPVVVAARPPYSGFSYITRPSTRRAYFAVLDNIDRIPGLTEKQIHLARTVFYVLQRIQKVDKRRLGLGTQGLSLGQPSDEDRTWREMLDELSAGDGHKRMLAYLAEIFDSGFLNLVDHSLLSAQPIGAIRGNIVDEEVLVS